MVGQGQVKISILKGRNWQVERVFTQQGQNRAGPTLNSKAPGVPSCVPHNEEKAPVAPGSSALHLCPAGTESY